MNDVAKYTDDIEDDDLPVGRVLTRREALAYLAGTSLISLAGATMLAGCGGGSGSSALTSLGTTSTATGRATLTITWPTTSTSSRLVPVDSSSITATFSANGTVVATQTVARPTSGGTSTVSFASLPTGTLSLTATAYPNSDGSGVAQATATTSTTITASQNTAVAITMASTIDHLTVTPSAPSVAVGATTTLAAAAYNASGSVVLTSASTISWASSNTAVATVSSAGVVTGVVAGTATITVTESESGKTASVSVTVAASAVSCVAFPQETEGPYWVDTGLTRSDVRVCASTNTGAVADSTSSTGYAQAGVPLTLSLYLTNVNNTCGPISGAVIDIWQCNATGIYSDESVESTLSQTWLRGNQTTDSNGMVTFKTIYPGWYSGRTTHIHFRLRFTSGGKSYNVTSQLFFNESLTSTVYSSASAYKSHGQKDTSNATDSVYNSPTTNACSGMVLSLTGSATTAFTSTFVLGIAV